MNREQKAIQQSLSHFIGTIIETSQYNNGKNARHDAVAVMSEEIIKLAKSDSGYDHFTLRPLYRAVIILLKQRRQDIALLPIDGLEEKLSEMDNVIKYFERLV